MIWKELKDFCNSLSEEQLNFPVRINREEEMISCLKTEILEENYVMDEYNEGAYPESEASGDEGELKVVFPKGFPMINEVF